jgi:hypothetical protein
LVVPEGVLGLHVSMDNVELFELVEATDELKNCEFDGLGGQLVLVNAIVKSHGHDLHDDIQPLLVFLLKSIYFLFQKIMSHLDQVRVVQFQQNLRFSIFKFFIFF